MLIIIVKSFLITFLALNLISVPALANEQEEAIQQMLDSPGFPESQKVKLRESLKKMKALDKVMASKTEFKNTKEWYKHFKYMSQRNSGKMESIRKKEKGALRKKMDAQYIMWENARFEVNKKFKKRLLNSKRFPDNLEKMSNFDNKAQPLYSAIEKMFLNHISAQMFESKKANVKTEMEKAQFEAMAKVHQSMNKMHALSIDDINFLEKEMNAYFKQHQNSYIRHLNANRKLRKASIRSFMKQVKVLKGPVPPKKDLKLPANIARDYYQRTGELEGIFYAEALIYQYFKVSDVADLKRHKLEKNVKITEFNKLLKLVRSTRDLDYVLKNQKSLRADIHSYQRRDLSTRIRDVRLERSDMTTTKEKESSIEKIKKWSKNFVKKSNAKKLKFKVLFSRNKYWFGNLHNF